MTAQRSTCSAVKLAWPVSQNLTVSFTRHEFLDYQESFQLDPRPIPGTTDNLSFTSGGNILAFFERVGTFDSVQANANFEGVSYAGSLAYKVPGIGNLSSTGLSVGLTVSVDRLSAQASTVRFVREEPVFFDSDSGAYLKQGCTSLLGAGCISFDVAASQIVRNQSTIDDDDVALGFTVGSLWRQSEDFSLGAVYTRSPKFKVQEAFGFNPGATTPVSTLFGGSLPPQLCCFPPFIPNSFTNEPIQTFAGFPRDVPFDVPDRLGAGVKVRPLDRLQFVFDLLRVYHSDLAQDLTIINEFQAESLTSADFAIADATEIHFGGEVMVMQQPIAGFLRAGVFTNPEHSLRFVGEINETGSSDLSNLNRTVQFRTLFNFVGRQTGPGITAGGGIAVPEVGGSDVGLQIDFAYVTIDSFDELVASFAVRF